MGLQMPESPLMGPAAAGSAVTFRVRFAKVVSSHTSVTLTLTRGFDAEALIFAGFVVCPPDQR